MSKKIRALYLSHENFKFTDAIRFFWRLQLFKIIKEFLFRHHSHGTSQL